MAYSSPLGSYFKLEKSIQVLEGETKKTPKKEEYMSFSQDSNSKTNCGFNRKYSKEKYSPYDQSPDLSKNSYSWHSPNQSNSPANSRDQTSRPISDYFHPSMLENPWEELEKV